MVAIVILILACVVAALAFLNFGDHGAARASRAPRAALAPAARPARVAMTTVALATRTAPGLFPDFEWDAPLESIGPAPYAPLALAPLADPSPAAASEVPSARIRDRYIEVRFPGVAKSGVELEDIERTVKAARLYFDEEKFTRAIELLEVAIEQSPAEEILRLAQLEIAFLRRDAVLFVALARNFRDACPASGEWTEVARLGRALAPDEAFFGAKQAARAHDHYGPWPHTPNWIQAPWDLTAEAVGADFHRAMTRRALKQAAPSFRQAA
ncbi:MAG: hypothetical protein ABI789_02925 [Usitatibacter sp.]